MTSTGVSRLIAVPTESQTQRAQTARSLAEMGGKVPDNELFPRRRDDISEKLLKKLNLVQDENPNCQ
jgi:hypothetical protein